MTTSGSGGGGGGRLEVVLDRSWEVQSITWSNLTWWDPLPCGQELLSSIKTSDPLPHPSPALSLLGHPPTPGRKLPPTHLSFRSMSASPSPIPTRTNPPYSFDDPRSYSSSPLAWPLPPSPDSYNSVFLHSSDSSSPSYPFPCTPSSISPTQFICSSPFNIAPTAPIFPTPPDTDGQPAYPPKCYKPSNMFNFTRQLPPIPPPPIPMPVFTPSPQCEDSFQGVPAFLPHLPPPSYY